MEVAYVAERSLLSASFERLFVTLASPDLPQVASKRNIRAHLRKWEKNLLPEILAVLEDAERKQTRSSSVQIWMTEVTDLFYDMEDVVDEFATEVLRHKLKKKHQAAAAAAAAAAAGGGGAKMSEVMKFKLSWFTAGYSRCRFNAEMSSKLKSITARLVAICKQKRDINVEEKATERVRGRGRPVRDQRVPTTSLPDSRIFGREKDKEALLDLLLATEPSQVAASAGGGGEGVSVIPIFGMGGLGKTTLAQLLYDDEKVKVHFDLRAWVYVSQTFDVLLITTAIMQSIGVEIRDDMTLDQLQLKLENFLSGKTFLFVLDDVWHVKYEDWCMLCKPLGIGALGSKIIVTTRYQGVATMMGTTQTYCLTYLSNDDCLSIFTHYALGAENFDGYPELKLVGEKIVEKCKGLPLAAKTLGVLLRSKLYYDEWVDVLESSVWDEAEGRNDILLVLQLSYDYITSHFKQCFVYCAILPNDYKFGMNELVKLWMAEGFLAPLNGAHPEDVGVEVFEALLSMSFFQLLNRDSKTFYMRKLIHDLARHFAGEIFVNMDANLEANEHSPTYQRTRHLSFIQCSHEVLERFTDLFHGNGLRTLLALPVLASNDYNWISNDVLNKLLLKLKQLRALSLSGYNLKEVPEPVSLLKHLRYLNLSKTVIRLLPEFVSSLLNLQTLLLRECKELEKLPMGIGNLSNLCYLDISGTRKLKEMPVGIGNLTGLRSLTKFIVGQGEVDGLNITELKDLSHLQGELSIQGLHNVKDIEDAREADLKGKQGLERLVMEWNHNLEDQVDATVATKVLELLQPHKDLKRLAIQFFSGTEFPSWIGDPLMMSNIVELELCNCVKITSLPPLGKLPVLKHLTVKGMTAVRTLGFEFYGCGDPFLALETLKFEDMLGWEEWCSSLTIAPTHFRSLKNLIVKNVLGSTLLEKICSNLTSLVSLR